MGNMLKLRPINPSSFLQIPFVQQFTTGVSHTSDLSARIVRRKLHKKCPLDNSVSRFFPNIVSQAIKNSGNSLAAGSDDLTIHRYTNILAVFMLTVNPQLFKF